MESYMEGYEDMGLATVVQWISSTAMVVGGMVPYIPQYREIKRLDNADGFSLYVCLNLLIANTLRILFWFGKRYELPLLVQSLIMNVTMFLMIRLCVEVKNRNQTIKGKDRVFTDFDARYFWSWTDFQSYLDFMLIFTVASSFVTYVMLDSAIYIELLGFFSVFTEAMLGMPQLLQNYKNKSTEGMSITMVCMWLTGDLFKTVYFILRSTPAQFWMCGMLQVSIDIIIILQVFQYKDSANGPSHTGRKD